MAAWFHAIPGGTELMFFGLANTLWTSITWWRDCIIEGDMGMHSEVVKQNLILGMWCFIASEAALFVGLLWSCLHMGIAPSVHVQMQWPPVGIEAVGWDKRALVMSAVLAASYYSANVAMVAKDPKTVMAAMLTTCGLGFMFLYDQVRRRGSGLCGKEETRQTPAEGGGSARRLGRHPAPLYLPRRWSAPFCFVCA